LFFSRFLGWDQKWSAHVYHTALCKLAANGGGMGAAAEPRGGQQGPGPLQNFFFFLI